MKKFISIYFGIHAIISFLIAFYILFAEPYQPSTNIQAFFCLIFFGCISTVIFLYIEKQRTKQDQAPEQERPELSDITVENYGDEKVMIMDNQIINL